MAEASELWQLHCITGSIRELVAQRECELSREGDKQGREWIREQMERWRKLCPDAAGRTWEMVREDGKQKALCDKRSGKTARNKSLW